MAQASIEGGGGVPVVKKTATEILKEKQAAVTAARAKAVAADPLLNKAVIPKDAPVGQHYTWIGGTTTGSWKLYNDIVIPGASNSGVVTTGKYAGSGTAADPFTLDGKPFNGSFGGTTYVNGIIKVSSITPPPGGITQAELDAALANQLKTLTATKAEEAAAAALLLKKQNQAFQTTALEDFKASMLMAGLGDLADTIDGYIKNDLTASQVKIEIIKTEAYEKRFPGMKLLRTKGQAINEATYISQERGFEQVLRAYGLDLKAFGTREKLGTYIENATSPVEFESRVQMAAERVKDKSEILGMLKTYYNVDTATAISYLLDNKVGLDIIKKQVRGAEIGAAAAASGFYFGYTQEAMAAGAEGLIPAVGTEDLFALKSDFAKARTFADAQQRLTELEGDKPYNQMSAVKAIVGQDQATILESQKRAARETARFGGTAGVTAKSLTRSTSV